ncbi:tetratricopeptide repeat protein, partial [Kibdelosporangium lantanae]
MLDLATAMHWYSDLRGDGELWREVFSAGADAARALGDVRAEAEQANYLSWALFILCGQPHEALKVHQRALAAATEAGDLVLEAWAYYYRSGIESRMVAPEAAVRYNRRAVELFSEAGYVNGQFLALSLLGKRLHTLGEYAEAVALHRECVAHYRGVVASPGNDELLSMAL